MIKFPIQYEPKRQNRFEIKFPENTNIESWTVQTASKPKFKNNIKDKRL
jgi:hypothetical protein